jgi:hypothetical protein
LDDEPGTVRMTVPDRAAATLVVRPNDPRKADGVADPVLVHYLTGLLGIELRAEGDRARPGEGRRRDAAARRSDGTTDSAAVDRRG